MEWWQLVLLFLSYIVCSILARTILATVKAGRDGGQCSRCMAYGQKAAPVQAQPVVQVINPAPEAPKK